MKYIFSGIFLYFFFGFFLYFFQRKIIFNTSKKPKPPSFYELNNVKDLSVGTLETIKKMPKYKEAIEKLKKELEKAAELKKENKLELEPENNLIK